MSSLKVEDVLNIPGRIALSPTNLTTAYPHGGTDVGFTGDVEYAPNYTYRPFLMREGGQSAFDVVEIPQDGMLTFLARQWDPDIQARIYPTTSTQTDGSELATLPGGKKNRFIGANGIKVVYSPLDSTKPGILFYRAVPTIMNLRLVFGRNVETVTLVSMYLLKDASSRYSAIEKLENLQAVLS